MRHRATVGCLDRSKRIGIGHDAPKDTLSDLDVVSATGLRRAFDAFSLVLSSFDLLIDVICLGVCTGQLLLKCLSLSRALRHPLSDTVDVISYLSQKRLRLFLCLLSKIDRLVSCRLSAHNLLL